MCPIDHFGFLAPVYEKIFRPPAQVDWRNLLRLPINGKILDACGGTGRVAQLLTSLGDTIIVLDESQQMAMETKKKPGIRVVRGQAELMPFMDGGFDRILMVDAFHHLADQKAAALDLWRVLRADGRLVIEEPDIRNHFVKLIAFGEKLLLMRSHFLKAEEIGTMFKDQGGQVEILARYGSIWVVVDK